MQASSRGLASSRGHLTLEIALCVLSFGNTNTPTKRKQNVFVFFVRHGEGEASGHYMKSVPAAVLEQFWPNSTRVPRQ